MNENSILCHGLSHFSGQIGTRVKFENKGQVYSVFVQPVDDPNGKLGEVWVEHAAINEFVVHNSGTADGAFRYVVVI